MAPWLTATAADACTAQGADVTSPVAVDKPRKRLPGLEDLQHPLLGDAVYGRRAGFARQMLHAWRLGFTHPRTGARLNFQSPIPADFREAGVPADLP